LSSGLGTPILQLLARTGRLGGADPGGRAADEPTFRIGEVAEMVGLSPPAIRTWERRYRLPAPDRRKGKDRRYTLEDVHILVRMRQASRVRGLSLRLAAELERGGLADALLPAEATAAPTDVSQDPDLWRCAADLLPQLMLVLDDRGQILDASMSVARAAGMLRGQLQRLRFTDMVDPYDRAKAVRTYRYLGCKRRDWELNLDIGKLTGLHSFDCWTVRSQGRRLVLLIGGPVEIHDAGLRSGPGSTDAGGPVTFDR